MSADLSVQTSHIPLYALFGEAALFNQVSTFLQKNEVLALHQALWVPEGYGEWIVRKKSKNEWGEVDLDTYKKVVPILEQYRAMPHRRSFLLREVQKIDSAVTLTFVPRVLYEMTFIEQGLREDLKKIEEDSDFQKIKTDIFGYFEIPKDTVKKKIAERDLYENCRALQRKCRIDQNSWFRSLSTKQTDWLSDPKRRQLKDYPDLIELAQRVNTIFCAFLSPYPSALSYTQLAHVFEERLIFYCKLSDSNSFEFKLGRFAYGGSLDGTRLGAFCHIGDGVTRSVTVTEKEKGPLRTIFHLENFSRRGAVLLYRVAEQGKDHPLYIADVCYCLSYGTGCFSGALFDQKACVFRYIGTRPISYALVLDPRDPKVQDVFAIPYEHPLFQLGGQGETFHARTKTWNNPAVKIRGWEGNVKWNGQQVYSLFADQDNSALPSDFRSSLDKEEFLTAFEQVRAQGINL